MVYTPTDAVIDPITNPAVHAREMNEF